MLEKMSIFDRICLIELSYSQQCDLEDSHGLPQSLQMASQIDNCWIHVGNLACCFAFVGALYSDP